MSAGFTPSPWTFAIDDKDIYVGTKGNAKHGYAIARVDYDDVDPDTAEADAHLIAAAPELYEALERLLNDVADKNDRLGICNPDLPADDPFNVAERALAKARGETL